MLGENSIQWTKTHRIATSRDRIATLGTLSVSLTLSGTLFAHGGVTHTDIALNLSSGLLYERFESDRDRLFDIIKAESVYTLGDVPITPIKSRGAPGIALFDYDGDGDLDIYVTNGPGAANSLYSNQKSETGQVSFIDVAAAAKVDAIGQDSSGTCAGDIDNDGDKDLLVLGTNEPNILYRNNGDGTFDDITDPDNLGGDERGHATCAMGDVNGDGLLDILVGNTWSACVKAPPIFSELEYQCGWEHQFPIFVEPYDLNDHNQLFINQGGGVFVDASEASGILNTTGFNPSTAAGSPTITWSVALVDVDLDGDLDIVQADDQAAIPDSANGGLDRGVLHIFENDGTGGFTDVSPQVGINKQGQWMGLAFGDLNCDGNMDIFGSNLGDFMVQNFPLEVPLPGQSTSRWFLRQDDGTYLDPGVGPLVANGFGWGTGILDYDNDGDQDIVYHGGMDAGPFVDASNPGAILQNQGCTAQFLDDTANASSTTDHIRRNVQGVAIGDLDGNGFMDTVSVSNFDQPPPIPLVDYPDDFGSPFDDAKFVPTFIPTQIEGVFEFSGIVLANGSLSVELNNGENGHNWVKVDTLGTVGITEGGVVNRDGIGAVVSFTPRGMAGTLKPVESGGSYGSSHSDVLGFGMGHKHHAQIDVLWPGGVRNRLYFARANQTFVFPEIPCSYDSEELTFWQYRSCVISSLRDIRAAGIISAAQALKLRLSALAAWAEEHH